MHAEAMDDLDKEQIFYNKAAASNIIGKPQRHK